MVGAVSNCADAVRLQTAPTGSGDNAVQHVGWVERPHPIRSNNLKAVKTHETHYSVIVSETQLQRYLPLSPIGLVVGVGFLLFFLRRSYLRKGRSFYVHTVWLWLSVQPNLRKIV